MPETIGGANTRFSKVRRSVPCTAKVRKVLSGHLLLKLNPKHKDCSASGQGRKTGQGASGVGGSSIGEFAEYGVEVAPGVTSSGDCRARKTPRDDYSGRRMPSLRMRACRVVRFMPRMAAAPRGPA